VFQCDEVKEELMDVVNFLKNPEKYNKIGAKPPKGNVNKSKIIYNQEFVGAIEEQN